MDKKEQITVWSPLFPKLEKLDAMLQVRVAASKQACVVIE